MKSIHRFLGLFLVICLFAAILPSPVFADNVTGSGYCGAEGNGANIVWTLDSSGTLTISGSGPMKNYSNSDRAPWHRSTFDSVVISDQVTTIGAQVFDDCRAIENVTIGEAVTSIGAAAFRKCTGLSVLKLPDSVVSIGESAFSVCNNLLHIDLGDNLEEIGKGAFNRCYQLQAITLPDSLTVIGPHAFCDCASLTSVIIPDGVTAIGRYAFYCCINLTHIRLPDRLTTIGDSAFSHCRLTEVVIPPAVTSIGSLAFRQDNFGSFEYEDGLTMEVPGEANPGPDFVYFLGNAPTATNAPQPDEWYPEASFSSSTTLYYDPTTFGWTDSEHYDLLTCMWRGYHAKPWQPSDALMVSALVRNNIVINGRGKGFAYFRLTETNGTPVVGSSVEVRVDGKSTQVITDENGVFAIPTPYEDYAAYHGSRRNGPVKKVLNADISAARATNIIGGNQAIHYRITPPVFTQEWDGYTAEGINIGIGYGVGADIGVASAEATLAGLETGLNIGSGLNITYDHTEIGHDLTLTHTDSIDGYYNFKSGIEATVLMTNVALADANASISLHDLRSTGLKIVNYDPSDFGQQLDIGAFLLQTILLGSRSVSVLQILEQLRVAGHNQTGASQMIVLEAGAALDRFETLTGSEASTEIASFSSEAVCVLEYEKAHDHLEDTTTFTVGAKEDYGYGLRKGVAFISASDQQTTLSQNYDLGQANTNSVSISAVSNSSNHLDSLSCKYYTGGEQNFSKMEVTDTYHELIFDDQAAKSIADKVPSLKQLAQEEKGIFSPMDLINSILAMSNGDEQADYRQVTNRKYGLSYEFPFSLQIFAEAGCQATGEFSYQCRHAGASGVKLNDQIYDLSRSQLTTDDIKAQEITLPELIMQPLTAMVSSANGWFVSALGAVCDGAMNGLASVTGAVNGWFAEIRCAEATAQSYAILAAAHEDTPITDAAAAVTVGEPYLVRICADEEGSQLVSEEALAKTPVTLTLSYSSDLLQTAGVSSDADLQVYWFDNTRNMYVCQTDSVQNKETMTVSIPLKKHGEYILATDNAAPLVSDFAVSDRTAKPVIRALVSDLSGISQFQFQLDDEETLVDETTLDKYYDPATGVFIYSVEKPLSSGAHKASFTACDTIGNQTATPFVFSFTVDAQAPVITAVSVPNKTVTDARGFHVTAAVENSQDLAGVSVAASANGFTATIPMTQEADGLWHGQVTEIAGLSYVDIYVSASDPAGNKTKSDVQRVYVDVPTTPVGLWVALGERTGRTVSVTVQNAQRNAVSGRLLCAAYDKQGKMLGLDSRFVGLTGNASETYQMTWNCSSDQIYEVRAFLMDGTAQYTPTALDSRFVVNEF